MNTERRIKTFAELGNFILSGDNELEQTVAGAYHQNKWFTADNVRFALKAIAEKYLNAEKLQKWLADYSGLKKDGCKRIGIVMAGNIPLAGFHDLLSVVIAGNVALIKLSSKDQQLLPFLIKKLMEFEPEMKGQIEVVEKLKDFDAVIATGSNNSLRYFEYYFGKYPHIFRKNRNSVAVLTGDESRTDLLNLGDDIFRYFGLGCRSVSKLFVPKDYDFERLFEALHPYETLMMHNGYKSNYDYNRTLLIMNNTRHFASDFLMLQESDSLASPIATLFYEYYQSLDEVKAKIQLHKDEMQCAVASHSIPGAVRFGKSQHPALSDYADNVDTVKFLGELKSR